VITRRSRTETRVITAILAASAGWGLAGVGTRAAFNQGATTLTVVAVRTGVAAFAVVLYGALARVRISRTAWWHGIQIGIPRIGLSPLFFIASLQHISAGVEGLIITLIPAATAALAFAALGERLGVRQVAGLLVGLAGTTVIIGSGASGLATGGNAALGGGLALIGVAFAALSGVLSRKYAPRHSTRTLALPMFVSGALTAALIAAVIGPVNMTELEPGTWLLLIALGLGSTLLPFGASLFASRHATAAVVSLTGYLAPLVGVIAGVVLLDEQITPTILLGGILALVGVALVSRRRRTGHRLEPRSVP